MSAGTLHSPDSRRVPQRTLDFKQVAACLFYQTGRTWFVVQPQLDAYTIQIKDKLTEIICVNPAYLIEPGVGRIGPENQQKRQGRSCQLKRQGGCLQHGGLVRKNAVDDCLIVQSHCERTSCQRKDWGPQGQDDAGGCDAENVAVVSGAAPMTLPVRVPKDCPPIDHALLLLLVRARRGDVVLQ